MDDLAIAQQTRDVMYKRDAAIKMLGISVEVTGMGSAEARFEVRSDMLNGFGLCHGGYLSCNSCNLVTLAAGASIEFLRSAKLGDQLVATATERYRGRKTGFYDVAVCNQDGDELALFRGRSHSTHDTLFS
jgi:acyl-CoA thioesterase